MVVEFRLLGEVALRVDGRVVATGHARQQCVLAALLVDANRVVPVDALLDRVWADRSPRYARNALSGYVSRLRQVLTATGEARLIRRSGGYQLTVDPLSVDLHRFPHLVNRARAASTEDEALRLFDRALRLWHGVAFATLDTPWLRTVRDALDADRLAAELDRNDLALRLGRPLAVLGELSRCAAQHPLDERVAGQLMLALYRSGGQAAALHRYERIRLALTEELGAAPGPALRELHHRILTADPTLGAPRPATDLPVPRQLPAPPGSFTGRAREIDQLDAIMDGALAVVSGPAGVGKTALALRWAHRVAGKFGDGQLYVNLRGFDPGGSAMRPDEALRGFLDVLGIPPQRVPAGLDAQAALYRSLLAGRRILVVLDNARDAGQVRPLLPGTAGCLVTSRDQLTSLVAGEDARPVTVGLLTAAESHRLLASRIGQDRIAAEPAAVDEIIARCAGLPLALTIVAARAAIHPRFPLEPLAEELRDNGGLDALTDLRAVFSASYRTLSPAAATLFRLLGIHVGPDVTVPTAASLAGLPAADVRMLLTELAHTNLITEHVPGRYAMHDLPHAYAIELGQRLDSQAEHQLATTRLLDHYLHTAHAADGLLRPNRDPLGLPRAHPGVTPEALGDPGQAMNWFTAEHPALVAAVARAEGASLTRHAWQLSRTLTTYFDQRARWQDWASTHRTAVAAARALADRAAEAEAHRGLAFAEAELGHYDDAHAHLGQALDLFDALGDRSGRAKTHLALSWTYNRQDRPEEARQHATAALDLSHNDRTGQARALNLIGWSGAQLRDPDAVIACERAIALHQEIDDRYGEAASWDTLGYARHRLGDHRRAITCYRKASELHHAVGDRHEEAQVLSHLGDTYTAIGEPSLATDAWHQALAILTELDHPDADHLRAKLLSLARPRR